MRDVVYSFEIRSGVFSSPEIPDPIEKITVRKQNLADLTWNQELQRRRADSASGLLLPAWGGLSEAWGPE
jgi:hypothetical protein